jgi:predicted secreted protein
MTPSFPHGFLYEFLQRFLVPASAATHDAQLRQSGKGGGCHGFRMSAVNCNGVWRTLLMVLLLAGPAAWAQGAFSTSQQVGTSSSPQTVTVNVTAPAGGVINQVEVLTAGVSGLDFSPGSGATTCVSGLSVLDNAICTESVVFTPTAPGLRIGAVVLLDAGENVLGMTYLSGSGLGGLGVLVPGNVIPVAGQYRQWTSTRDGVAATLADLDQPASLVLDGAGNMYIADSAHNRIRKVTAPVAPALVGTISTYAGTGNPSYTGDGGKAVNATLSVPSSVALDGAGNLYIADAGNNVVRKVTPSTGFITTVAGTGAAGYSGDGGAATLAKLNQPLGITVDASGNLYIADTYNQVIRKVDAGTGFITTVAGNGHLSAAGDGKGTFSGDGGPATSAGLSLPYAVAFDATANMYIPDSANNRVRMVTPAGVIGTFAGTGAAGGSGNGGPANAAQLNAPTGVALDPAGNVYIADTQNTAIRKVKADSGEMTLLVSNANSNTLSNGTLGTVQIYAPVGLFVDGKGDVYFADFYYMLVEEILSNQSVRNFTFTPVQAGSKSATQSQTVENDGNATLDLTAITPDANAAIDAAATSCSTSVPLDVDADCEIGVQFAPSLTLLFPAGATSEGVDANINVNGNTANFPTDMEDFPLDIVLAGTATPVNATTLALTSSKNPSLYGQSVTFTATLTAGTGAGTPAGTVTFMDGATTLAANVPLNTSGVALYTTTTPLAVGVHAITATYTAAQGSNFLPSNATLSQEVDEATAIKLASSANPSLLNQLVTFTATVSISGGGGVPPDGTVAFFDGATALGTVAINAGGVAIYQSAALAIGVHPITAVYSGDAANDILPITSAVLSQDVQEPPTVAVASNLNPSTYGVAVTFTATVVGNGTIVPTGAVNFLDGGVKFATGTLAGTSGIVTATTSALAAGTHAITAVYQGDTNYSALTSSAISQVVNKASTSTALVATPTPGIAGLPVALTATVKMAPGAGAITGTVSFTDGTTNLGSVGLTAAGTAAINPILTPGAHTIVATYSGDANDNASASSPLVVTVIQATTATVVTSAPNPSIVLYPVVFTAKVTGNGATPTGTVTFLSDGVSMGSSTLGAAGTATFTYSALAAGTHAITAVYAGDANDAGSTSAALSQVVGTIPTITGLGVSATTGTNPTTILVATVLNNASSTGTTPLPTPTGTVTFMIGATVVGAAPVDSSGVATLVPNLPNGTSNIVAVYSGDAIHSPSTSSSVSVSSTPLGYNLTVTPGKVSVAASQNVAVTVTLTSESGFTDTIGLGCASLPSGVNCHFAQDAPNLPANGIQAVQLTIDTNNPLGGGASAMNTRPGSRSIAWAGLFLPLSILFGLAWGRFRRRYAAVLSTVLLLLLGGGAMLVTGCSGFSQSTAAPGTYVIQVTGVGDNSDITHYQNVTLTITAK